MLDHNILDDFIAEDDILDEVLDQAMGVMKNSMEALQKEADDHRLHPPKYIRRPREDFSHRLVDDYFSDCLFIQNFSPKISYGQTPFSAYC